MAARKRTTLSEEWKQKIKTTQLINRLQGSAMGEIDLTAQQIKSIEILLKKVAPDLKSVENTGNPDKPVSIELTSQALSMMTKEQLEALLAGQSTNNAE